MKKYLLFVSFVLSAGVLFAQEQDPNPEAFFSIPTGGVNQEFSIFFAGNVADFTNLPEAIRAWNKKCIEQLKVFLDANPQYKVIVKGCVNGSNENGLDAERIEQAIKLAHFEGVTPDRIAERRPVAGKEMLAAVGSENEWMNRRVDFVLVFR